MAEGVSDEIEAIATVGAQVVEAHAERRPTRPRSFSICMKSERVRRASPLARTCPAIWIAPP